MKSQNFEFLRSKRAVLADLAGFAEQYARGGDVLLSITADLGRVAVVPHDLGPAHISQHLARLRLRGIEAEFLSAFLASNGGQRQFARLNRHAVKAGLNFDDIRGVEVLVAPPRLQQALVSAKVQICALRARHRDAESTSRSLFDSLVARAFAGERS